MMGVSVPQVVAGLPKEGEPVRSEELPAVGSLGVPGNRGAVDSDLDVLGGEGWIVEVVDAGDQAGGDGVERWRLRYWTAVTVPTA